jgi:RES domain-containing protein
MYTASSLALCALELLATRAGELPDDYVAFSVAIPDSIAITRWSEADLPANWWAIPHPTETQELGTRWALEMHSAVLSVPSAVIRSERNYIINLAHPDLNRLTLW